MVRVGPDAYDELVRQPHARRMDFTGRPMKGFLYVGSEGLEADADLERWVGHGLRYATSLPVEGTPGRLAPKRPPARHGAVKRGKASRAAGTRAARARSAARRRP